MEISGGCHCGAGRFQAALAGPPVGALACNCSICALTGFLHVMVPHTDFELLSGWDALASYRFGSGAANHLFCTTCGVKSFYQPRSHPDCWSLNAHCFDRPVDLEIERFDGKNWEQAKASLDGASDAG